MATLLLLNKPYDVLCQFRDQAQRATLADYITDDALKGFYPAGRLDRDSEGLVALTDQGPLQHRIAHPDHKLAKQYWAQLEGEIHPEAIDQLRHGVELKDGRTRPAKVETIAEPTLWPRAVPIRQRANIPTSWISLTLTEGKNRQVRRMTAAVGFPTLRLIRVAIGSWRLDDLQPGQYRLEQVHIPQPATNKSAPRAATHKSAGPPARRNPGANKR